MSEPGPGGHGGGGDLDLEELRRTNPRRAARLEERRRLEAAGGPRPSAHEAPVPAAEAVAAEPVAAEPVAAEPVAAEPVAHDGYVDPSSGAWTEAHEPVAHEPVAHEPVADGEYVTYDDPAEHEAAYATHYEGGYPAHQDAFGDPVSDGYVDTTVYTPEPRRHGRRALRLLLLTGVVAAVGVAGWFAWQQISPLLGQARDIELFAGAADFEGPGEGQVEVVVAPGENGRAIGATLVDAEVVASVDAFVEAANAEPEFRSVQPGTYTLPQRIPATEAVAGLLDPANRVRADAVVIAEGLRVEQVLDRLAERTGADRDELEAALDEIELPPSAPSPDVALVHPAEGFLYPDGYQFPDDATPVQMLQAMVDRGQQVLAEVGVPPEEQLRVLTEASLIQGEARLDEDFGRVAQVVENRIEQGIPLQLDSTVNYATQTFDIRTTGEQRESDSPYNTYRVQGLPPAPIKNPGRQAIEAALNPTPGPWVYFVTVDLCTGETAFAETLSEHNANVDQLNAFQRENSVDGQLVCD